MVSYHFFFLYESPVLNAQRTLLQPVYFPWFPLGSLDGTKYEFILLVNGYVLQFQHASSPYPGEGPPQMRKMFIGGLSHETNDDALRAYFSQWGHVVDAIVIRDPTTKQSRGFGFVTFATLASLEAAMADRPHVIAGKTVDSKRAIPREQMTPMFPPPFFACDQAPGCKLLLSGLNWDYHRVDTLRVYFEKFGSLDQVEILGDHRGFGFVVFEDKQSADKCLNENNGRHIIASKRVDVRPFPKRQSTYWRRNPDAPSGGTTNAAAPPAPPTLYDQLAAMNLNSRATQYDEDSNYGGTTTEVRFRSFYSEWQQRLQLR
ncbi:hypothetical protein OESDEN_00138 [Oesophagostomum dentatum]|uniref:RRM domain-containing protein n=1 Tax=Oesophagostomum dentatum TaxID=61180 RepID=A0A0B1TRF4_OESDE|nr:hypothetical protein OESDEN_00138 [Oesophagostomum dentatum]